MSIIFLLYYQSTIYKTNFFPKLILLHFEIWIGFFKKSQWQPRGKLILIQEAMKTASKEKKVMTLTEKINLLDKMSNGRKSLASLGREFGINKSTSDLFKGVKVKFNQVWQLVLQKMQDNLYM